MMNTTPERLIAKNFFICRYFSVYEQLKGVHAFRGYFGPHSSKKLKFACRQFWLITVNVLKLRTLKNNYFSAVRNFRNYVHEKLPVFVILECGLYHEKNGIYACQNVVETC